MKWVCKVCGRVIESNERPIACPLCGACSDYIVPGKDFKGIQKATKQKTVENLNSALSLEKNATSLYEKFAKESREHGDDDAAMMFTALARIEAGHQISIKKRLGQC
ncbi:MAG: ferritin family protein [Candidatus Aenigmatarchaeota archaeon]